MDNDYIYVNIFKPFCSKCKCEINEFNLSLAYWCKCDNEKEKIYNKSFIPSKNKHLSEIYKKIEYKKYPLHKLKVKTENKISIFIKKIKAFLKSLIIYKIKPKSNLFNFSNKPYIKETDQKISFFDEEYSEKLVDLVNNINSSNFKPNTLKALKTFILDIHFFILILKKNPLIYKKIIFQDIYTKYPDDLIYDYNIEFQDLLKKYFDKDYNNYYSCNDELVQIFPIIEKNIILLIYNNYIKMYNFIFNNFVLTVKAKIGGTKICKINPENLVILDDSRLYFSKIEYDSENNPIKIYYFDSIKLPCAIIDFDIVNENNIVFIDMFNTIFLLNITYNKNNIIYNISEKGEIFYYNYYNYEYDTYILVDKINKQIVLSSEILIEDWHWWNTYNNYNLFIKFYDINLSPKNKEFKFKENRFYICPNDLIRGTKLKYLNSNLYILFFYKKIYLISSKYLEIISEIIINISSNYLCYNSIILEKSKNIILCSKYEQHLFKLFHNEIILDEKSTWNTCLNGTDYNKFNIIEVNEKGDFIIIKYGKIYKKLELTILIMKKLKIFSLKK